jgi:hypothetical protein
MPTSLIQAVYSEFQQRFAYEPLLVRAPAALT